MALNVVSSDRLSTNVKTSNLATGLSDKVGQNKNLIINGACAVAQRSTSAVTDDSYRTVDRFSLGYGGIDEHPTQARHALTSSDTGPWEKGFRYSFHVTNGNQTSGAGAADYMEIYQYIEDQNISQSGWNYASSSSYLTISFWVKSSVAQKFYGFLYTNQAAAGDCKMYSFVIDNGSGGNLAADTWTKITHTIDGDSSLTFNNDNTNGLAVGIFPFEGTDYTTSGHSLNTWAAWSSSNKVPDMTSTWWTTNDATFEITGLQLEVGDTATEFEHRSYADELARCQRYFQQIGATGQDGSYTIAAGYLYDTGNKIAVGYTPPVPFRATPTMTNGSTTLQAKTPSAGTENVTSYNFIEVVEPSTWISISGVSAGDLGNDHDICLWTCPSNGLVQMSAEL